jgi:hypothetical protein
VLIEREADLNLGLRGFFLGSRALQMLLELPWNYKPQYAKSFLSQMQYYTSNVTLKHHIPLGMEFDMRTSFFPFFFFDE